MGQLCSTNTTSLHWRCRVPPWNWLMIGNIHWACSARGISHDVALSKTFTDKIVSWEHDWPTLGGKRKVSAKCWKIWYDWYVVFTIKLRTFSPQGYVEGFKLYFEYETGIELPIGLTCACVAVSLNDMAAAFGDRLCESSGCNCSYHQREVALSGCGADHKEAQTSFMCSTPPSNEQILTH